jgi:hypothetical protein
MDYPEVLKPENAVKDDETFGSSEVYMLNFFYYRSRTYNAL